MVVIVATFAVPHRLWSASVMGKSAPKSGGQDVKTPPDEVLPFPRLVDRFFLPRPSFALILFQPLLCALMARCRLPGEVLKPQSDVGGVVGGVSGSPDGGGVDSLESVWLSGSRLQASVENEDEERAAASALRPRFN